MPFLAKIVGGIFFPTYLMWQGFSVYALLLYLAPLAFIFILTYLGVIFLAQGLWLAAASYGLAHSKKQ